MRTVLGDRVLELEMLDDAGRQQVLENDGVPDTSVRMVRYLLSTASWHRSRTGIRQ